MSKDKNTVEPTEVIEIAKEEANAQAPSTADPKKEEKPKQQEQPKPAQKAKEEPKPNPVNVPKQEEQEETRAQKFMKNYIERYLDINDGMLDTEAKKRQAIDAFKKLCYHAISNASDLAVLDMVLDLFKTHRGKILSEELALQGLSKFSKTEQMQLSVFYRMFFDYSNPLRNQRKKKPAVNMDQVRSIFGDDHIVNYLVRKFPK